MEHEHSAIDEHPEIAAVYVPALKKARLMILIVGILYALSGLGYYFLMQDKFPPQVLNIVLATNLILAAIHVGLWLWAKKSPLAASVVALVLFVTLHLANAILDPSSIYMGIIVKIIFIVLLVQGIRAGLTTRRLLSEGLTDPTGTD